MNTKPSFPGDFARQWITMGVSLFIVILLGFFLFRAQAQARFLDNTDQLAVNLHSTAEADYSASLRPNSLAAVGLEIIADILRDEEPDSPDTAPRLTQIANVLLTPVASVTGASGEVVIPSDTPRPSNTPGPTPTGPTPTARLSPTITLSPTFGPSPTPTNSATPGPSPTATKSPTPGPSPTATKSATPGPSSTATRTPTVTQTATIGPSSTPTVTQTQTATASHTPTNTLLPPTATNTSLPPTATNTNLPPTATNTVDVCGSISLSGFSAYANKADWQINNGSTGDIEIDEIFFQWPGTNGNLRFVRLDSANIWQGTGTPTSITINSGWQGASRVIGAGGARVLQFQFASGSAGTGYTVRVTFDNGCQVQQNN
ncbi:MAG: hypothetical protein DWQ07_21980 [Chloroflexi bacterium]|nr:MAG: hypothetical protein DWQ07_21980 [Chloroflexota bacterium]MBL1196376.1 hypothetical protein [Chloroflexota bacterium]NOH13671.1 hypothetical protein [Chloroflexota bacterium]